MKKLENQHVPLSRYEIFCYTVIWALGVIHVSYSIFDMSSSKNFKFIYFLKHLHSSNVFFKNKI